MASDPDASDREVHHDPSDNELVRRVQRELPYGTAGFRALVERHSGLVFRRALRLVGSPADAEEVVQNVFLRVFLSIDRFRFERPFVHWLQTITGNAARNLLRGRYRERRRRTELAASLSGAAAPAPAPDTLGFASVQRALDTLDPTTRIAVSLRFIEEQSFPEIAEQLGLGESAVKMRVRRGLARLRTTLSEDFDGDIS